MDDCPEIVIKKLCCTCLSKDRKLYQLCRIFDGINDLYWLLTHDSEAYREGFYKDTANLFICWECKALLRRITLFRQQACIAQKHLTTLADGRAELQHWTLCLSHLSCYNKTSYDSIICIEDNFVDCGPDVKSESEEDIPLSELTNYISDGVNENIEYENENHEKVKKKRTKNSEKKPKASKKNSPNSDKNKKYFTSTIITEADMYGSREQRKMNAFYVDSAYKCEGCIEGFKNKVDFDKHNLNFHTQKENHTACDICYVYIKDVLLEEHRSSHYSRHDCRFCDYVSYDLSDMLTHLKTGHAMRKIATVERKKGQRKTPLVLKPGSKPRRNQAMMDKRTPFGYLCTECNKYFDNKNQRWKHVQRFHREGYKCNTCGKRFAFRNNLSRHEQLHISPPPRVECKTCNKLVRLDLLKAHSNIHARRQSYECIECDKRFVSRASYEHHLKYTYTHAHTHTLKYKCTMCDKGYRSRGELRDHVNYQHMGRTQHKCPICGKALATRRCITRHVRRAHDGVKESAKDKICQQCGKAFRDKKGLREHEFIHTGERPLSCEICGCTFRQSASLYTHKKRVHKIHPQRKVVQLVENLPLN